MTGANLRSSQGDAVTHEAFTALLEQRITQMRSVLSTKAKEYASDADRLHNFKRAAAVLGTTPAKACMAFMTKHFVSVQDIVSAAAIGQATPQAVIDENLGDLCNYVVLLEAILKETP
jgi:hypothetical protein